MYELSERSEWRSLRRRHGPGSSRVCLVGESRTLIELWGAFGRYEPDMLSCGFRRAGMGEYELIECDYTELDFAR